jgi:hypothetical protein
MRTEFKIIVTSLVLGLVPSNAWAYLHPQLGRFMQRDPIEYFGGGGNLYEYELSAAMTLLDPSGLAPAPDFDKAVPKNCNGLSIDQAIAAMNEAYNRSAYYWDNVGGTPLQRAWWDRFKSIERCLQRKLAYDTSLSDFYMCNRGMQGEWFGYHVFLQTPPPSAGYVGLSLGGSEKKDDPPRHEPPLSPVTFPLKCKACSRSGHVLKAGSGTGTPGWKATDAQILECLKAQRARRDYLPLVYDCKIWSDEAASACGLRCPMASQIHPLISP